MLKKAEATANASVHILLGKLGYIHYYIAIADMEKAKKILQEVEKLIADDKLASSARTSDPRIFTESIFPSAFGNAAMESYMEAQDSYGALFEDKSKYDAVMSALAGVIYREMRSKKTVDYRKIERNEQVQMVAEEPAKYGK